MYYIYYVRDLQLIDGKWKQKSIEGVSLADDTNYDNCCGKETIKFFRKVFGSKETTQRKNGAMIHTSQLNDEKHQHYFIPIGSATYDLIKEIKTKINLKDLKQYNREELESFIKTYYTECKKNPYILEKVVLFIELYNSMNY